MELLLSSCYRADQSIDLIKKSKLMNAVIRLITVSRASQTRNRIARYRQELSKHSLDTPAPCGRPSDIQSYRHTRSDSVWRAENDLPIDRTNFAV